MEINVSGKQVELGDALQAHIDNRLHEGVKKYLDKVNQVYVVVSKEGHQFRADIHANIGTHEHIAINGRGQNDDVYAAFDEACEKIEKQLRRYKRRLKDHHAKETVDRLPARDYVISIDDSKEDEPSDDAPLIIAENAMHIETLTVSEAVMRMDLADIPAYMFYNAKNGRVNMVYRRPDGNISWVDPERAEQAA